MADGFRMECRICGHEHDPRVACPDPAYELSGLRKFTEDLEGRIAQSKDNQLRIEALRAASRLWGGLLSNENVEPSETVEKAMLASANQFLRWLRDE